LLPLIATVYCCNHCCRVLLPCVAAIYCCHLLLPSIAAIYRYRPGQLSLEPVYRSWQSVSNRPLHHGVNTSTGCTRYAHDLFLARSPLTVSCDREHAMMALRLEYHVHWLIHTHLRSAAYSVTGEFTQDSVPRYFTAYKAYRLVLSKVSQRPLLRNQMESTHRPATATGFIWRGGALRPFTRRHWLLPQSQSHASRPHVLDDPGFLSSDWGTGLHPSASSRLQSPPWALGAPLL
jgi:hypothetical protein